MAQPRSDELQRQEEELARAEAELAARESALVAREHEIEVALGRHRERLHGLEEKLRALAKAGSAEADAFVRSLPELPPAPGQGDRNKAVIARREAVSSRTNGALAREKALAAVAAGASRLEAALSTAEAEGNQIEAAFAAARRKAAEERKAAESKAVESKGAAAPPPLPAAQAGPPVLEPAAKPAAAAATTPSGAKPLGRIEPPRPAAAKGGPPPDRKRTRIDCDVSIESESNFFEGFARNLSEGGLFIAAWDYQPVGTEMDVAFSLPGGPRIETRAVVRWVRELNDATPDVWPGMGLQFLSLPPGAEEAIKKFMSEREPLFFPD